MASRSSVIQPIGKRLKQRRVRGCMRTVSGAAIAIRRLYPTMSDISPKVGGHARREGAPVAPDRRVVGRVPFWRTDALSPKPGVQHLGIRRVRQQSPVDPAFRRSHTGFRNGAHLQMFKRIQGPVHDRVERIRKRLRMMLKPLEDRWFNQDVHGMSSLRKQGDTNIAISAKHIKCESAPSRRSRLA